MHKVLFFLFVFFSLNSLSAEPISSSQDIEDDKVEGLIEVIRSTRLQSAIVRSKAIQTLVLFHQDKRVKAFVTELFHQRKDKKLFPAIIIAFGELEGEGATEEIAHYLESKNEALRMAAIIALGRYGGQPGAELLAQRLEIEKSPKHKVRIRVYLY